MLIGLIAAFLLGCIIILLMQIRLDGNIKYSTSITMILFFDGICSLFALIILLILRKFYQSTTMLTTTSLDEYSLVYNKMSIIIISGIVVRLSHNYIFIGLIFAFAVLSLAGAMNQRPFSRFYSLLILIPIPLLFIETLIERQLTVDNSQMISMSTLVVGALMIILGEPKHHYSEIKEFKYPQVTRGNGFGTKK